MITQKQALDSSAHASHSDTVRTGCLFASLRQMLALLSSTAMSAGILNSVTQGTKFWYGNIGSIVVTLTSCPHLLNTYLRTHFAITRLWNYDSQRSYLGTGKNRNSSTDRRRSVFFFFFF